LRRLDITDDDCNLSPQCSGRDPFRYGFKVGAAAGKKDAEPAVGRLDVQLI